MHFNFIFIKLECSGLVLYVKFTGETMYHLLMHCVVANELWSLVFSVFGVQWVVLTWVIDVLFGWKICFGQHRTSLIWKATPFCLMWTIWRQRNNCRFTVWRYL